MSALFPSERKYSPGTRWRSLGVKCQYLLGIPFRWQAAAFQKVHLRGSQPAPWRGRASGDGGKAVHDEMKFFFFTTLRCGSRGSSCQDGTTSAPVRLGRNVYRVRPLLSRTGVIDICILHCWSSCCSVAERVFRILRTNMMPRYELTFRFGIAE